MKSFYEIREKTLTPAELKKREEIAKAMERDNPGMDMGKKMAIATATAKRVAEARASISVGSADKKPENYRDQDGKIAEATNQKLFMFKTEAEAKAHAKKNGGKVVKYSPTNYAVLDKDLTKKPGKKPDGMVKESELDEKYDTPVKKKPVSMMSKAEKDKNDERRKAYKEFQKSLRKEEAQIDEISMGKMAAYADKAVKSRNDAKARTYSADTHRVTKAGETIRKRKAGADNYNKKMWGYANVAPTKESVDEAKVSPSHDEIMKAIGHTQSSAQGMAILQKKFKLTAAQARKHMDMFLKDDVNEGAPYDSGWQDPKPVKKDKSGNVIKDKNVAKNLAKSAMKSFKDIRKK